MVAPQSTGSRVRQRMEWSNHATRRCLGGQRELRTGAEGNSRVQEIARNFPEEPAFQTYSSRLSLSAVKHAIGRAGLAEAARLHAGLRDLISPSSGEQSLVADFAEASVALCIVCQEHSKWEELFSLAKTTAWAVRSEAFRGRIIAKGGETTWTETAQWLDGVLAAAR